ncbi:MAG TPA: hypothetical protein VN682_20255 [Terriglobales bacterium]|nr:hypothetical protein [Terriglobales bacterium]
MAKKSRRSPICTTYEIAEQNPDGEWSTFPFSDSLSISGKLAKQAITKMRMLQSVGWPAAILALIDDYGQHLIVKKDDVIWLLKCKPSCWRLYFYVRERQDNENRIAYVTYVYAVCKKQDEEDSQDAIHARTIADTIRPGGNRIAPFEFPPY